MVSKVFCVQAFKILRLYSAELQSSIYPFTLRAANTGLTILEKLY